MSGIVPAFDPVIHAPQRLQACAVLASADEVEFATLRDTLVVSDSVLSKHVKQLEDAGYVRIRKAARDGRARTWLSLTREGRRALAAHVAELERLATMIAPQVAMAGDAA
jgi:DNA-binding MarR family transcriptional regulator